MGFNSHKIFREFISISIGGRLKVSTKENIMQKDYQPSNLKAITTPEDFISYQLERTQQIISQIESIGTRPVELTDEMCRVLSFIRNNAKLAVSSNKEILLEHYYEQEANYMRIYLQMELCKK
jgi:hypothetical protein